MMLWILLLFYLIILVMVLNGLLQRIIMIAIFGLLIKLTLHWSHEKYPVKKITLCLVSAYFLGTITLLLFQYNIDHQSMAINYVENNQTAVILIYEGEPPTYQLPYATRNLVQNNRLWEYPLLPLQLFRQKLLYESTNSLENHYYTDNFKQKLSNILGNNYQVYTGYLNNIPYVEEVIQQAIEAGNGKLIIAPVLLSESKSIDRIQQSILAVNPQQYRVKLKSTHPLWDSEGLAQSFVERIIQQIDYRYKSRTGVLLVGGSHQRGMEDQLHVKQEILFQEKVRDFLLAEGFQPQQVTRSFLNRKDIHSQLNLLMEQGVNQILIMQVLPGGEGIEMRHQLEKILSQRNDDLKVEFSQVSGWRYNDQLLLELAKRIELINLQKWD